MAYSNTTYTADGSTRLYAVPFSYIAKGHVEVWVDQTLLTAGYTWPTDASVQLTNAPASGAKITIKRNTPKDARLVDFQDGSVLTENILDLDANQSFFVVQEAWDRSDIVLDKAQQVIEAGDNAKQYAEWAFKYERLAYDHMANTSDSEDRAKAYKELAGSYAEQTETAASTIEQARSEVASNTDYVESAKSDILVARDLVISQASLAGAILQDAQAAATQAQDVAAGALTTAQQAQAAADEVQAIIDVASTLDVTMKADITYVDTQLATKANTSALAAVATSGAYSDLTGKPTLFSGNYADLVGLPSLFSGSYTDLTNKPTLFSGAWADLTGKPSLATVATSGLYSDLTGKPTLFSGSYTDLTNKPSLFSGSYSDLTGKPTLGTSASHDVASTGDASTVQVVKGDDSRLTNSRAPTTHTHATSDVTGLDTTLAGKASLGANTFTGDQALGNHSVTGIKLATFNSQGTIAATTGAITVDWTAYQNQKQTEPTGSITYTFTAPPAPCRLQLLIDSDGTSTAQTFTWPGTVKWIGSVWAAVANKAAVITFWYDGTSYWAVGANQA